MLCFIPIIFYFLYASRPHVTIPICTPSLVSLFPDEGSRRLSKHLICFWLTWLVFSSRLLWVYLATQAFTTSNFHLYQNHTHRGNDDHPGPSSASAIKTMSKQLTLRVTLPKSTLFSSKSVKHKLLVDATADFICQGLQPPSVVGKPAFRRLLEIAQLRFRLPHHMHSTDTVILQSNAQLEQPLKSS